VLLSVVVPARNEALRIRPLLEGLARQEGLGGAPFELVVVDDHSTDGTADVVRETLAGRLAPLTVVDSRPLPPGWKGKCWACQQGAEAARGAWLLFLDADVAPGPHLLAALLGRAQAGRRDVLSVMPRLVLGSPAERLVLPAFMGLLYALYPLHRVSDARSPVAFANGQVLLVSRAAYARLGGHAAVRDSLLEDTHFGQRAREAGLGLEVAAAPALADIRMYTDWASLAEGLGKNAVAGFQSGGARSGWVGLRQALLAFGPPLLAGAGAALLWHGAPGGGAALLAGGGVLLLAWAVGAFLAHRRYRAGVPWAPLLPLGLALYFGLSARALWRLRRGAGVTWKGRTLGA
jgi:hypothetical protein